MSICICIKLLRRYVRDAPIRPDPTYPHAIRIVVREECRSAAIRPQFFQTKPRDVPRKLSSSGLLERNSYCSKWPERVFPKTSESSLIT